MWWDYFCLGFLLLFNVEIMMLLKYFIHLSLENLHFYSRVNSPYKNKETDWAEWMSGWAVQGCSCSFFSSTVFNNVIFCNSSMYSACCCAADIDKGSYYKGLRGFCCCIVIYLWGFFTWFECLRHEYLSGTFSNWCGNFRTVVSRMSCLICALPRLLLNSGILQTNISECPS